MNNVVHFCSFKFQEG